MGAIAIFVAPPTLLKMQPLVSILIPAFNAQQWIGDAIKSALAQTWGQKEIIVVDDGSTDGTLAIARNFTYNSVRVVTQCNQGAAAARNKAYSICQGDYIQWLDADDVMNPDKLTKQIEVLERSANNRTIVSSAWGHFAYRRDRAYFSPNSLWCDLSPLEWLLRKLRHNHFMSCAVWLVSRELTNAAGPWDTRLSVDDDGEYFARVVRASDLVRFVSEAKVLYRRSPNSLSQIGESMRGRESQFLSVQLQISHLRSMEDSERTKRACLEFLKTYALCFYPERLDLFDKLQELAIDLGGDLEVPRLSWKYSGIQKAFGWTAAKRAQLLYNQLKAAILSSWDAALFRLKM